MGFVDINRTGWWGKDKDENEMSKTPVGAWGSMGFSCAREGTACSIGPPCRCPGCTELGHGYTEAAAGTVPDAGDK